LIGTGAVSSKSIKCLPGKGENTGEPDNSQRGIKKAHPINQMSLNIFQIF
jgi:hypothetical protein